MVSQAIRYWHMPNGHLSGFGPTVLLMDATHDDDPLHVSRTDHDGGWTVAVDLQPVADEHVTAELIGATAVVAVDSPIRRTEFDISLPGEDGTATLRNGVLVVESTV